MSISVEVCGRNSHSISLCVVLFREQDVLKHRIFVLCRVSFADMTLYFTQVISHGGRRQPWVYIDVLRWGPSDVFSVKRELYLRSATIECQCRGGRNVHGYPWSISSLKLFLTRNGLYSRSVRCDLGCLGLLLQDFQLPFYAIGVLDGISGGLVNGVRSCLRLFLNFRVLLHDFDKLAFHHIQLAKIDKDSYGPDHGQGGINRELQPFNESCLTVFFPSHFFFFGMLCFCLAKLTLIFRLQDCRWWWFGVRVHGFLIGFFSVAHISTL